jgi:hypothetical protein
MKRTASAKRSAEPNLNFGLKNLMVGKNDK